MSAYNGYDFEEYLGILFFINHAMRSKPKEKSTSEANTNSYIVHLTSNQLHLKRKICEEQMQNKTQRTQTNLYSY